MKTFSFLFVCLFIIGFSSCGNPTTRDRPLSDSTANDSATWGDTVGSDTLDSL